MRTDKVSGFCSVSFSVELPWSIAQIATIKARKANMSPSEYVTKVLIKEIKKDIF